MFRLALLAMMLAVTNIAPAQAVDAHALLVRADAPRQLFLKTKVKVRATMTHGDKPDSVSDLELYIGDEDHQLVLFKDSKAKGRKFLMRCDKSWLLVPGSKHPVAISANQRMLGNLSFADLARINLATDYSGQVRPGLEACPSHDGPAWRAAPGRRRCPALGCRHAEGRPKPLTVAADRHHHAQCGLHAVAAAG